MPTSTWSLTRSTSGERVVNEWSTSGQRMVAVDASCQHCAKDKE